TVVGVDQVRLEVAECRATRLEEARADGGIAGEGRGQVVGAPLPDVGRDEAAHREVLVQAVARLVVHDVGDACGRVALRALAKEVQARAVPEGVTPVRAGDLHQQAYLRVEPGDVGGHRPLRLET